MKDSMEKLEHVTMTYYATHKNVYQICSSYIMYEYSFLLYCRVHTHT